MTNLDDDDEVPQAVEVSPDEAAPAPAAAASASGPTQPVPVTLITGFLGAGKTTLIRHILTAPHGLRIAVILNEFGEGVENAYYQDIQGLRDNSGEWVELDNGCMCCSVKSEFVQALEALLAKERRPDYILIETTGLANPGPVAAALWTDEEVEAGVQLDGIITVVDAINIGRQLNAPRGDSAINEAQVQVAYADLILLNKLDLASDEAVAVAEADIRAINSSVHIIRTSHCSVDLHLLLNRNGYKGGAEVQLAPIAEDEGDDEEGEEDENGGGRQGEGSSDGDAPRALPDEPRVVADLGLEVVGTRLAPPSGSGFPHSSSQSSLQQQLSNTAPIGGGGASGGVPLTSAALQQQERLQTTCNMMSRIGLSRSSVGGMSSHSRAVSLSMEPLVGAGSETDDLGAGSGHGHGGHHDPQIQTVCLTSERPLELDKIKSWMDKLLWDREQHPEDIYRVKGVLQIQGDPRKHMLQAVYELYNVSPSAPWREGEKRVSRVVIIGRQLNKDSLDKWFAALAAA